jgi:hypothetical protein
LALTFWLGLGLGKSQARPGKIVGFGLAWFGAMAFGREPENSLALALALMNLRPGQSQLKPKPEKAKAKPKSHGFLA